jgi:putative aminopeptidase FrvX
MILAVPIPPLLSGLLETPGPSGHESGPARVWRQAVADFAAEVRTDVMGSTAARVPGTADGLTLALIGHIDEIGLHVTHITADGFLRFDKVGGWDPMQLVGQRVRILARTGAVVGVIGRQPVHLLQGEEAESAPKITDLRIDIAATDADDAGAVVRVGDVAVIDVEPVEMAHDRVVARALDNRIGAFVVAEAARLIAAQGGAPGDVWAVASAQEEIGLNGARTSTFGLAPDLVIVVDTTPATDSPGADLGALNDHVLGAGPVVARGISLHPALSELLLDSAEAHDIAVTVESLGAQTGSDADSVHISRAGVPTALVSVTIRYMHSPVEMASIADIQNAAALIAAFAQRLDPALDLRR